MQELSVQTNHTILHLTEGIFKREDGNWLFFHKGFEDIPLIPEVHGIAASRYALAQLFARFYGSTDL